MRLFNTAWTSDGTRGYFACTCVLQTGRTGAVRERIYHAQWTTDKRYWKISAQEPARKLARPPSALRCDTGAAAALRATVRRATGGAFWKQSVAVAGLVAAFAHLSILPSWTPAKVCFYLCAQVSKTQTTHNDVHTSFSNCWASWTSTTQK